MISSTKNRNIIGDKEGEWNGTRMILLGASVWMTGIEHR